MSSIYGISHSDSCSEAAKKIFTVEFAAISQSAQGVIDHEDTVPLHELRVAMRRFRAAIRLFKPLLKNTHAQEIDDELGKLGDELSNQRDSDAWLECLLSPGIKAGLVDDPSYQTYLDQLYDQRIQNLPQLCFLLSSECYVELTTMIEDFIATEIGSDAMADKGYLPYTQGRLLSLYCSILESPEVGSNTRQKTLHKFRKRCRRGRYWCEFLADASDSQVKSMRKYLRRIADALGSLRDLDIQNQKFSETGFTQHAWFAEQQALSAENAWEIYRDSWQKITSKSFRKAAKQTLEDS